MSKLTRPTRVAQEKLHTLARHDALTGLPNRPVFSAELQTVLNRARGGSAPYSVLLVGLDRFKQPNDLKGHPVGDVVLCEVARRLEEIVRNNGMVAEGIEDPTILLRLAAKGCEFGQDYYFGKAVTAERVGDMLRERAIAQRRIAEPRQAA